MMRLIIIWIVTLFMAVGLSACEDDEEKTDTPVESADAGSAGEAAGGEGGEQAADAGEQASDAGESAEDSGGEEAADEDAAGSESE